MGIGPGDLRNKVEQAKWLLYSMRELSGIFNKEAYPPLTELMVRMEKGVRTQLLDLIKLKGVGRVRARSLFNRGFTDVEAIRRADVTSLAAVIGIGETLARSLKEKVGPPTIGEREVPGPIAEKEPPRSGQTRLTDYN
jgi:helicase